MCLAAAWLLEGLAGFLCDQFVKRYMGNNEARYRRFKVLYLTIFKVHEASCLQLTSVYEYNYVLLEIQNY